MHRRWPQSLTALVSVLIVSGVGGALLGGYSLPGPKWGATSVPYFVNPHSIHVSPSAAVSAVQTAAATWNEQAGAAISLVYAGLTAATTVSLNRRNEVLFRPVANDTALAETYFWWDGAGRLVDADIVFYEGSTTYYAGSGCLSRGAYIENVGAHEFGHLLGLGHSEFPQATMSPTVSGGCDRAQLTLEVDDLAALDALYPPLRSTLPAQQPATLWTRGYLVGDQHKVDAGWTGITAATVDAYRNGVRLATFSNVGGGTDHLNTHGAATYTYQICAAGTTVCTNVSTVTFR